MSMNHDVFINFFRQVAPYLHQHRQQTFVFCLQENQAKDAERLGEILHDLVILQSLGVRVVIVFGARASINQALPESQFHRQQRITDSASMETILQVVGRKALRIEAMLSMGLDNSPMKGASVQTASGNYIAAKPLGIIEGVDMGLTGVVRKVKTEAICARLVAGEIVLISPLGFSATGEIFNLETEALAAEVAMALGAGKLIYFNDSVDSVLMCVEQSEPCNQTRSLTAKAACELTGLDVRAAALLQHASHACSAGVRRVHLINTAESGAAMRELFTRDGCGIMITDEEYDSLQQATIDDIPSLLALIKPFEEQGILVRRSRELLEQEIGCFTLLKRDNLVIGCAALYPYQDEGFAELSCLVVDPAYRHGGRADLLLQHIEDQAKKRKIDKLFCLTTHTSHWFRERGFVETSIQTLPVKKQQMYNYKRSSQPLLKIL